MILLDGGMGPDWWVHLTWEQVAAMGIWATVAVALLVAVVWLVDLYNRE